MALFVITAGAAGTVGYCELAAAARSYNISGQWNPNLNPCIETLVETTVANVTNKIMFIENSSETVIENMLNNTAFREIPLEITNENMSNRIESIKMCI